MPGVRAFVRQVKLNYEGAEIVQQQFLSGGVLNVLMVVYDICVLSILTFQY